MTPGRTHVRHLGPEEDLAETKRQVEALGRRVFTAKADVRDIDALQRAVDDGGAELGRLDPVDVSNAVLFLASDEARYVSGAQLPVDAAAAVQ